MTVLGTKALAGSFFIPAGQQESQGMQPETDSPCPLTCPGDQHPQGATPTLVVGRGLWALRPSRKSQLQKGDEAPDFALVSQGGEEGQPGADSSEGPQGKLQSSLALVTRTQGPCTYGALGRGDPQDYGNGTASL